MSSMLLFAGLGTARMALDVSKGGGEDWPPVTESGFGEQFNRDLFIRR